MLRSLHAHARTVSRTRTTPPPHVHTLPLPTHLGRYQFYKGTITKAICTSCQAKYIVKKSGTACCESWGACASAS